jgi:DNA-binding NtrC family response regulator
VERIVILSDRDTISRDDILNALPSAQKKGNKVGKSLREAVREYERDLILDTLARCGHNITDASKILEIERSHLYKKMRQYGIR